MGELGSLWTRFWDQISRTETCWNWQGYKNPRGYGYIGVYRSGQWKSVGAHRVAWEFLVGEIPDGYHIDHLCLNKSCVNPKHLQVLSLSAHGFKHARRPTHCPQNHEYNDKNTYTWLDGKGLLNRRCRECNKVKAREYRMRVKLKLDDEAAMVPA